MLIDKYRHRSWLKSLIPLLIVGHHNACARSFFFNVHLHQQRAQKSNWLRSTPHWPPSLLCPSIFTKVSDCVSIAGLRIASSVHREQTYGHREEEGERNSDDNIETYTFLCVKQIASGNLLCDTGSSNPDLCHNLEEWDGEGGREGPYVYLWLIRVDVTNTIL